MADNSDEIWCSSQSVPQTVSEAVPTPKHPLVTTTTRTSPEEYTVKDSIVMMGHQHPTPKQPGPKTPGPLDTRIPKKTPPGEEQSRIGGSLQGQDVSHLYRVRQRERTNDDRRASTEQFISVPYAAGMYKPSGEAIQMKAISGAQEQVLGSAMAFSRASVVGRTSSVLASNAVTTGRNQTLPPLTRSSSRDMVTDEQKLAATTSKGKPRSSGSRPSSSASIGSRASSACSLRTTMTTPMDGSSQAKKSGNGTKPYSLTAAPPREFTCPLTKQVMRHPVKFVDGHTYEKSAILAWCEKNSTSPLTNEAICEVRYEVDIDMKNKIKTWKKERMAAMLAMANAEDQDPHAMSKIDS